ncbi:hypothetical protein KCU92_g9850, partial [Aureobasidium melanogenum]
MAVAMPNLGIWLRRTTNWMGGPDQRSSWKEDIASEVGDENLASEESSKDKSDSDDDASADASEEMSEDESGEDWDEMKEKAKKRDRESGLDDQDRRPAKGGKSKKREIIRTKLDA